MQSFFPSFGLLRVFPFAMCSLMFNFWTLFPRGWPWTGMWNHQCSGIFKAQKCSCQPGITTVMTRHVLTLHTSSCWILNQVWGRCVHIQSLPKPETKKFWRKIHIHLCTCCTKKEASPYLAVFGVPLTPGHLWEHIPAPTLIPWSITRTLGFLL